MKSLFKKTLVFFLALSICPILCLSVLAVDEAYQYSDEYKSSKFYTALRSYELTGDAGKDLAAIAQTQVGYHEGDSEADMHGNKTSGAGDFVEYNRLHGRLNGGYGYEWNVSFVIWCARHAGITETELPNDINVKNLVGEFSSTGRFYQKETGYMPNAGDLVFFFGSNTAPTRVGIITSFEDNKINTVEGNFGEAVKKRSYESDDLNIQGYATLREPSGEFFVSKSTDLFLPSGEYFTTIPAGGTVSVTAFEGRKVKLTYNGTEAWADITFLFPNDSFSFSVSYDSGEGRGAPKAQSFRPGAEVKISEKKPILNGSTFIGWATEEGGEALYRPGDKYTGSESATLYAVWQANQYTVKFLDPDGSVISEKTYLYCEEIEVPQDPSMATDGENKFVFENWDAKVQRFCYGDAVYTAVYKSVPLTDAEKAQLTKAADTSPALTTAADDSGCSSFAPACALAAAVLSAVVFKRKKH